MVLEGGCRYRNQNQNLFRKLKLHVLLFSPIISTLHLKKHKHLKFKFIFHFILLKNNNRNNGKWLAFM